MYFSFDVEKRTFSSVFRPIIIRISLDTAISIQELQKYRFDMHTKCIERSQRKTLGRIRIRIRVHPIHHEEQDIPSK